MSVNYNAEESNEEKKEKKGDCLTPSATMLVLLVGVIVLVVRGFAQIGG